MTWKPDYVTVAELKDYLHVEDSTDDLKIGLWVTAASRAVDDYCGRQFGRTAALELRTYSHHSYDRNLLCWVTNVDDICDTSDLVVLNETGDEVDYRLEPENAIARGGVYERLITSVPGPFAVSTRPGWLAVPAAVRTATLIQGSRFAARQDSPFGVAGSPSEGSEVRLQATLDPDLKTALGPTYRSRWWAA